VDKQAGEDGGKENEEGQPKNSDCTEESVKEPKKGKRRIKFFQGVLTSPEGLKWVIGYENKKVKSNVTRSSVTVVSRLGDTVIHDGNVDAHSHGGCTAGTYLISSDDLGFHIHIHTNEQFHNQIITF